MVETSNMPVVQVAPVRVMEPDPRLRVASPLAHVQFCFYCALFCEPLGAMERCPDCGRIYPRE